MPKIVDHDAYRKELLGKCFDLFAEKGYAALTMREIAQGLGVSTGTLYHYFANKEVLFEQLVREMTLNDIQQAIARIKQKQTTLDRPLDRVEAVFHFIAEHEDYFIKQTLIWVEFYQQQRRETGGHITVFKEVWKESEQEVNELLGLKNQTLLDFLGCFIDGMLLHRIFDPDEFSFQEQTNLLMDMLKLYLDQSHALLEEP
jgi:AcrR family transcriptional regulator